MIKRTSELIDAILTLKIRAHYLQENGVAAYYGKNTDYHIQSLEQECGCIELAIADFRDALSNSRKIAAQEQQMEAAE